MLFGGTVEPRKNVAALLRAYAADRDVIRMPLMIAGGKGWWFDEIFSLANQLRIEDDVNFLGFVPADDLPLYYGTATALVYPSLYEGFGLPPLEAMVPGLPVVSSNAGAIREVVGDAAIIAPAESEQALAQAIVQVTLDPMLRQIMRSRGLVRGRNLMDGGGGKDPAGAEGCPVMDRVVKASK